jgi:rhodanese-related sulfurtransferase
VIPKISPIDARRLIDEGRARLVDIREPLEHARESIPGAALVPLSSLDAGLPSSLAADGRTLIFHCQGGRRTQDNAGQLSACSAGKLYLLDGGLEAWKKAGLATRLDKSKPIELQRQVQIAAGSLVLAGLLLAVVVSAWFALLTAFVGSGLVFAGVSGWCGMARLLQRMPWNRVAQ